MRLDDAGGSSSTLKPFAFLEAIAQAERALSVSELSGLLNVPQPTAHRIVHMLESDGFLEREPGSRRYVPGARLVRLGFGVVSVSARTAPRRAILEALSKEIGETCNFGIRVGNHLMYLDRVEAAWPFGLRFEPGSRVPLHCTSMGKLFLSFMSPIQRQRLLKIAPLHHYTEHTITDPTQLEDEFERIRALDYSTDDQEFLAGVVCVAVPVRAQNGGVAAGLAVSAPLARMSMKRAIQCVPLLRAAAERMADTFDRASEPLIRGEKK
ncbi:IclR family transcriptional regulator [Bradyrhizobium sp. URHD0069]|uniref:IclR family transcriptional regulator n=1 Tax=Bradyrhizobium sp. URHD0069 TaxID=1380355 RepID=UPI001AEBD5CA|nr:IclR family transcriptional regulator [Bradyrhizobium sp. URHD0069]